MKYSMVFAVGLVSAACAPEPEESAPMVDEADTATEAASAAPVAVFPRTPAPEGARAFITAPADGAVVSSPFTVEFGAENIVIVKAGDNAAMSGHHHLIVNAPLPELSMPIPATDQYRHFGGAQESVELTLEPGPYSLQLLFGDYLHIPHDPPIYSEVINITVE